MKHEKRQRILLFILLTSSFILLCPFGWLGELWPAFGIWLGWVFATALAHAMGHTLIFLSLGLVLLGAFRQLHSRLWLYFGLMLVAGIMQESFQLFYKQRPLVFDDFRDLFTDLIGASLAFCFVRYRILKRLTDSLSR